MASSGERRPQGTVDLATWGGLPCSPDRYPTVAAVGDNPVHVLRPRAIEDDLVVPDALPVVSIRHPYRRREIFGRTGDLTVSPHGYEAPAACSDAGYLLISGSTEGVLGRG